MAKLCPECIHPLETKGILKKTHTCRNTECSLYNQKVIPLDTLEKKNRQTLEKVVQKFSPTWVSYKSLSGKRKTKLEGGENGTNALLARFLRERDFKVDLEVPQSNGSRVDLLVNGKTVLECKPKLISRGKLDSLVGEIRRLRSLNKFSTIWAVIYGNARKDLYKQLKQEVGKENVIVLGKLLDSRFD